MKNNRVGFGGLFLLLLVAGRMEAQQPLESGWGGFSARHGRPPQQTVSDPMSRRAAALERLAEQRQRAWPDERARQRVRHAADPTVSLARLLHAPPPKAERYVQRAQEAFAAGEERKGVEHLERAIEIHPDYIEARNNLGVHYQRAGRYQEAAQQFAAALALDPSLAQAYTNMSLALGGLGRIDEALDHARRGHELAPRSPAAKYALGAALAASRTNTDEAVEMFRTASTVYPRARLFAVDLLLAQGKPLEARLELQQFLSGDNALTEEETAPDDSAGASE